MEIVFRLKKQESKAFHQKISFIGPLPWIQAYFSSNFSNFSVVVAFVFNFKPSKHMYIDIAIFTYVYVIFIINALSILPLAVGLRIPAAATCAGHLAESEIISWLPCQMMDGAQRNRPVGQLLS